MTSKLILTEQERRAAADKLTHCRHCGKKFSPQGLKMHERFCPAVIRGR